jgi:putative colanic acid biosynthesis UDP-glucose lipid carrier transferase
MTGNNQSNNLIKLGIVIGDFVILNIFLVLFLIVFPQYDRWSDEKTRAFFLVCNLAFVICQSKFSTVIHQRRVGADSILKRTTLLVVCEVLLAYLFLRLIRFEARLGWQLVLIGVVLLTIIMIIRLIERWAIKKYRELGRNTRYFTLVGTDSEILTVHKKLTQNSTLGYKIRGYYGDLEEIPHDGSIDDFFSKLDTPEELKLGDEVYLCVPRRDREKIMSAIKMCDQHFIKFYYVPLAEENLHLEPVMLDGQEIFTAYKSPLENPLQRLLKRFSDIIISVLCLLVTALLFPFIYLMIKCQSPGPIFFKQRRTGLNGREFNCYKFRSMHVNKDADRVQATKDDPRKYPFGNFMRKTNIDELPQFWNVLCGDMSIVGPRPHMLAHTEQYSKLIDKYMVRHFVKPGVTGWAQVTGFRGETRELWQMEGRVERDIWYIQHWSLWLDIRIIWMTIKTVFRTDANAY